ncbi:MAG: efflux RND transporter periplasmic adaptor subunit [Bacteroidales bacterium]|nr:efflux RND transporter periplasmic adaptor subunit [Bacteroidales bacterium]
MKRILFCACGCIAALLAMACQGPAKQQENATATVKLEQVRSLKMEAVEIDRKVELPATLNAWEEVHLAPASPGRIEAFKVDVSDVVKKGDILVQMDRTQLLQTELQLKNYETEYNRAKILYNAGSYSKQNYDQIKTQYEVAKTNVDYLRTNTILRAPFSGIVSGKYFENGEMYSGSPIASIGKAAVLSLVEIDKLKTTIAIPESFYPLVKKGMTADITSDVYPGQKFKGTVHIVYPIVNPTSRTFDVELEIDNREQILRPGMFARVALAVGKAETVIVPDYAVLKMQGSNERYIFVVDNGTARRIVVKIGDRFNDRVEILSERLEPGMELITEGQGRLNDGVAVQVVE